MAKPDEPAPLLVRMPKKLHDAVKARAVAEERSMAGLVRNALRAYLKGKP